MPAPKAPNKAIFYVYALLDPRKPGPFRYGRWVFNYEPFYIGKGHGDRAYHHKVDHRENYNLFKTNIINKLHKSGLEHLTVVKKWGLTDKQSMDLEVKLISLIGRRNLKDGPLTNLTNGGEGCSGAIHSALTLKRRSKSVKASWDTMSDLDKKSRRDKQVATKSLWSSSKRKSVVRKRLATMSETDIKTKVASTKKRSLSMRKHWSDKTEAELKSVSKAYSLGQLSRRRAEIPEKQKALVKAAKTNKLILLDAYVDMNTKIKHRHTVCGHEWYRLPRYTLDGHGCPVSSCYHKTQN